MSQENRNSRKIQIVSIFIYTIDVV